MISKPSKIDPTALPVRTLAGILEKTKLCGDAEEKIQQDIRAGAPVNPDGSVHLVRYVAWLKRNVHRDYAVGIETLAAVC